MDPGNGDEASPSGDDLVVVVEIEPGSNVRVVDVGARAHDVQITETGDADRARVAVHLTTDDPHAERLRDLVNAAILDALPSAVALLDERGVIRSVNAGWVRLSIERPDDPLVAEPGTDYRALLQRLAADPTSRDVADAIASVLDGRVDLASTDHPADDTDTSTWFTVRVAPVDVDGARWAVVSFEDVSAVRHALERWHSTFSDAAVPTLLVDGEGVIMDANQAFAALVGVDLASTIRRSSIDFVHPDDHEMVYGLIEQALAGAPIEDPVELRLSRSDGTTATVVMHPSEVSPEVRRVWVVQLLDITSQRRAEARLALQRELLELVAAGTPLTDVATAVSLNVGRAIDGAAGAVVLAGSAPFVGPGVQPDALGRGWSVPIDRARAARGELVVLPPGTIGMPDPDDLGAAEMLASIVRLAVQRDETATAMTTTARELPTGLPTADVFCDELERTLRWAGRRTGVGVLAVGPAELDQLVGTAGWRQAELTLADLVALVRATVPHAAMLARRSHHVLVLVEAHDRTVRELAGLVAAHDGVAVGVATAKRADTGADALVDEAEEALAAMQRSTDEDFAAADLRRGFDAGEITVHYQPIIDLTSGGTSGLEALVRWRHPSRGFVPPPELIHIAETCGLINELGALVLTTACRDLVSFRSRGAADLTVAVNLSAHQLADDGLVALVRDALDVCGLDPSALVVEITESVVVDDVAVVASALAALRELGVRVAIDDFGTGYSSLLYLKRFPADVLKVDRSFVQGLGVHEGDTAIVDAVVGLGHRLGLEVVAEGVETHDQLAELRRRRCDHAQGYLLQRPVPATEIDAFLERDGIVLGPEPPLTAQTELGVDQLISLVTHELSTPLAVIGGHAELLVDRMHDDGDVEVIGAIERNIRNLDDLLRTLSGLGQALGDAGPSTTIDLVPFVEQTVQDLAPLLAHHEVHVAASDDAAACADVEPVAVRQIVTNLLSNAVKFTAQGTRIDVDVHQEDATHVITIADHGPGVPVDREDELFGRFARLGASARGLGLGLHLSRALARRQGGDLVHQRTPGGGATFVLSLPR